jgi:hypothetical protein
MAVSFARLRALLDYDPKTGRFTWRRNGLGRFMRKGAIAGTLRKNGYRQICIDQTIYMAGRLAIFWMTGEWPPEVSDHINRAPDDNRWSNLRPATMSQNGANSIDRLSGVPLKGVTWDKRVGQYQAQIRVNYRNVFLGRFDRAEDAHAAYVAAAKHYFGDFARTS